MFLSKTLAHGQILLLYLGWHEVTQTPPQFITDVGASIGHGPINYYMVFWNPDSSTDKEVTLQIFRQTEPMPQTIYNYSTLALGIALVAVGAIIGIVSTLKLGRRAFFTAIALVMIVSGAFGAYSNWVQRPFNNYPPWPQAL